MKNKLEVGENAWKKPKFFSTTQKAFYNLTKDLRLNIFSCLPRLDIVKTFQVNRICSLYAREERTWREIASRNELENKFLLWGFQYSEKFIYYKEGFFHFRKTQQDFKGLSQVEFDKEVLTCDEYKARFILANPEFIKRLSLSAFDVKKVFNKTQLKNKHLSNFMKICLSTEELSLLLLIMLTHVEDKVDYKKIFISACDLYPNLLRKILEEPKDYIALMNTKYFIVELTGDCDLAINILANKKYQKYFTAESLIIIKNKVELQIDLLKKYSEPRVNI